MQLNIYKVSKKAKIRNRYIKYHTWPRTLHGKVTKHNQESQEVSPFPAADLKAAMNRQESMTNTKHK